MRLHSDGWPAHSITGYLEVSRPTVYATLRRWLVAGFAGLDDRLHSRLRERNAGRRGQADALIWVTGAVYSDEELPRLFTLRLSQRLDQLAHVRVRHERIHGERGLAGQAGAVWLYEENLTVHLADEPLTQYKVVHEWDQKTLKTVTEPRLFETQISQPGYCSGSQGPRDGMS